MYVCFKQVYKTLCIRNVTKQAKYRVQSEPGLYTLQMDQSKQHNNGSLQTSRAASALLVIESVSLWLRALYMVVVDWCIKGPILKKTCFSGLFIYKLVLPQPANSQNEENKQFLHGLCSPPTGKTALLQAVQIQLLSLRNKSHYHRPTSSAR